MFSNLKNGILSKLFKPLIVTSIQFLHQVFDQRKLSPEIKFQTSNIIQMNVVNDLDTTFICTLHIHITAITTMITHELLPSGLVPQLVEQ